MVELQIQDARRVLENAAARAKEDIEVLYALGMASKMSGERDEARRIFNSLSQVPVEAEEDTRSAMLKRMAGLQILLLDRD